MIKDAVLLIVVLVTEKNEAQFLHLLLQQKTVSDNLLDNGRSFVIFKLHPIGPGHSQMDICNIAGGPGEGTNEDGWA